MCASASLVSSQTTSSSTLTWDETLGELSDALDTLLKRFAEIQKSCCRI
jgi:hypothetical protein